MSFDIIEESLWRGFYDPIVEFVRDCRLEQPFFPPEVYPLRDRIRTCYAFAILTHPQEGPVWVFEDDVSLLLGDRLRRPLDIQRAAALGGYEALEGLRAPPPYVGYYLDIASLPSLLTVGNIRLVVRLPALIAWDLHRYLAMAPVWGDEVAEELHRALSRLPFLPKEARNPETGGLDEGLCLSAWAQVVLAGGRLHKTGIPLRYVFLEGLSPPPLPPARDVRDLFRRALEDQLYGHGIHSRKARRAFVPLEDHDAPAHHEVVDAIAVRQAMERLPQHLRGAIELVYLEGLTQQEAARRLGISQQALSKRLQQACRLLLKSLA